MDILDRAPEILSAMEHCTSHNENAPVLFSDVVSLIRTLQSELARVQKDRDAALYDMKALINDDLTDCETCKKQTPDCGRNCDWEWRGVKEGNNATSDV